MAQFNLIYRKACLFSIPSLFAVMYNFSELNDLSFFYHSFSITTNIVLGICIFVLLYFFYKHVINQVCIFSRQSKIIGLFAGIINVLGKNFMLNNSMLFFYKDISFAIVFSLLAAIGYGLIYASAFELGWHYLKVFGKKEIGIKEDSTIANTVSFIIFDKHPLLYPFFLITLFWLPYLISFFPGMLQWDAVSALFGYYGVTAWTNQHPVIGTLLMGYIMDIGKYYGNDSLGCAIYVILQFFLLAITLAYNFVFFKKWKTNYFIRWLVLIFYLLHPVFPTFVMTEVKDVFYYIAYLWLLFLFIRWFEDTRTNVIVGIVFASMFLCAIRKEGVFICIVCSIVLLLFQETIYEKWKSILNAIMLGSVFAMIFSYGATVYYNVDNAPVKEALSIPVQQTARYIRDYSEDITESEWKILNSIFQNKANKLGSYYVPDISDPVKAQIDNLSFKVQMTDYFKIWGSHFFRHPGCYFSAAFNQIYGYFYIGKEAMYKIGDCRTENFKKGDRFYSEQFRIVDTPSTMKFRKAMIEYIYSWPEIPLLGYLYHPAVYTWVLFFGLSFLIHIKEYKYLFLYCMPLLILCICCLSPANAFIRYSYPIMISCFVLLAYNLRIVSLNLY